MRSAQASPAGAGWRIRPCRPDRHPSDGRGDRPLDRPLDRRLDRRPVDRRLRMRRAELLPRLDPMMGAWARLRGRVWTWRAGRGPLH